MSGQEEDYQSYDYESMGYEDMDMGYGDTGGQTQVVGTGEAVEDYGYGDDAGAAVEKPAEDKPKRSRARRNSCVIRKDEDPLAVADFLMGGCPKDGTPATS